MTERRVDVLLLLVAVLARVLHAALEPAFIHPDALYQALEPAYRLVSGHGHQAWEFEQGVRSWLWPGVLAAAMWIPANLGLAGEGWGTDAILGAASTVTAVVDAAALVLWGHVAARFVDPPARRGVVAATVILGSVLPAWVIPGSQPIIGVPTSLAMAWACLEAFREEEIRPVRLGAAAATLTFVRVQMAPVAVVLVAYALWRDRSRAAYVAAGFALVATGFGVLDWLTWGSPWASTARYLTFSFTRSEEVFGSMPGPRYLVHFFKATGFFGVALVGVALTAFRRAFPAWLVLLAAVLPHQLVGQKQLHFLHPIMPLLAGIAVVGVWAQIEGLGVVVRRVVIAACGVLVLVSAWLGYSRQSYWETTWLANQAGGGLALVDRSRGLDEAYRFLATEPAPTRVIQAVLPRSATPGHALLGHDVPEIHLLEGEVPGAPRPGDVVVTFRGPPPPGGTEVWRDGRGTVVYRLSGELGLAPSAAAD